MTRRRFSFFAFAVLLVGTAVQAQVPRTLSYQGLLTDTVGTPLPDGSYSITFRLYQSSTGGSALWQEARTLQTKRGVFSTNLGDLTPIGLSFDRQYWLGIQISGNPELAPRMAMTASGYSLHSQKADTATYALTAPQQGVVDSARVAGTIPNNSVSTAKIQNSAVSSAKILDGTIQRADVASNFKAPRSDTADYTISGTLGPWQINGSNISYTSGNVGIGTASPTAKVHVENSAGTGVYSNSSSGIGVWGEGITWGLYGNSTSNTGVVGSSSTGYGVSGTGATGVYGSGSVYGVYGNSSSGTGVYGISTNSYGVYAASSNGYGLYATGGPNGVVASAISGAGVSGTSSGGPGVVAIGGTNGLEATGTSRGVYATGNNYGVVGGSTSGTGVYGSGLYGVIGVATQGFQGYGIYASDGDISGTWGGWFHGSVGVSEFLSVDGFIYKYGGGFRIDHPTDPANKYLYHSFVESPDMKNIYDGVVTMDAQGEAIITLPDWFGPLNKDFRYQLTAIGAPGPNLHIAQKISNNRFRISGGTTGMEVCWQVTGIRKDAYTTAHRIPVEVEKTGKEKGKYLQPEAHGAPTSLGMRYEENQKMAAELKKMEEQNTKMEAERKLHEEQRAKMEQERLLIEKQDRPSNKKEREP